MQTATVCFPATQLPKKASALSVLSRFLISSVCYRYKKNKLPTMSEHHNTLKLRRIHAIASGCMYKLKAMGYIKTWVDVGCRVKGTAMVRRRYRGVIACLHEIFPRTNRLHCSPPYETHSFQTGYRLHKLQTSCYRVVFLLEALRNAVAALKYSS